MHQINLPDGYIAVPNDKIAAVVTYLVLARPSGNAVDRPAPEQRFVRLTGCDAEAYRALFGEIGMPWLWFSRLAMTDDELAAILDNKMVEAFAIMSGDRRIGLAELDFRVSGEAEIAFFGLIPEMLGKGLASPAFASLLDAAWARPIRRVIVHTCTLDHPSALGFYLKNGFRPYKRAIEIADDPRLTGTVPRHAGIRFPLLDR